MRMPEIILTDGGFAIISGEATDIVRFDEVSAIIAYKVDELTTDLVCCDVVTDAGEGEQMRTIHEELPGFGAAMASFESLPGFDRTWGEAVISPSFEANRTVIYRRGAA